MSSELAISSKALGLRSANSVILMTSLKMGIFCEPMSDEMMKSALYRSGVHAKYCALGKIIGSKFCVKSATFVTSSVSILMSVSNLMTSEVKKSPSWTQFSKKSFQGDVTNSRFDWQMKTLVDFKAYYHENQIECA